MRPRSILGSICLVLFLAQVGLSQELTVWHTENDPNTLKALDAIARSFEAENPGVRVNLTSVGWDDLYRKLTIAIRSGELPALTQIEPFMAAYLYQSGSLLPMDDVINALNPDDIFPAVRDLQLFDGKRYGIATALGISYYSFRSGMLSKGTSPSQIKNWNDYLQLTRSVKTAHPDTAPLLLPANDLHITLLFTELLASNGGSLFDASGKPDFANRKVIETLTFWRDLYELVPTSLRNSPYGENFTHYAAGRAFSLPCFFGRGTTQIERTAPEEQRSPESFSMFPHPVGPSGSAAYATLDAEPWVLLKGAPNGDLARRFLGFFYQKPNYLKFAGSVPIHLTPIFRSLATSGDYVQLPLVQKWRPYHDYEIAMLDKNAVLPIFMARPEDRFLPALFKLEGSRIISTMVREVSAQRISPEQAAQNAMAKSTQLLEGLPTVTGTRPVSPSVAAAIAVVVVIAGLTVWLVVRRRAGRRTA